MTEQGTFGDLRGMLQYVPRFRDRTFVVAVDGALLASPSCLANILLDIEALRSLNIYVVLVHGAAWQIRRLADQRGVPISDDTGAGATDEATVEICIDAISRLSSTLMQHLTTRSIRAATANALIAHRAGVVEGRDLGFTGRIDRVDAASLRTFLKDGMVPVVSPLGYDGHGNTWRLNSDQAAADVAVALGADKVIYLVAEDEAVEDRQMSVADTRDHLEEHRDSLSRGWRSKLETAVSACGEGVSRVHLVRGMKSDAPLLEELFSNEGIGTMVFADAYHRIRKAEQSDVDAMVSMMESAVAGEKLLRRSHEEIMEMLGDYSVIEVDRNIVGTVAIHLYPDERVAELGCLFVKRSHEKQGYGGAMVEFAEGEARKLGAESLIVLTTQAIDYFTRIAGFEKMEARALPVERRERYEASERNSAILRKAL